MRFPIALAAMATLVAGQAFDPAMIAAAPDPLATGPDVNVLSETIAYAAAASGSAAVTATAAAVAQQSQPAKRGLIEARTFYGGQTISTWCKWFGWGCPAPAPAPAPSPARPTTTTTPTRPTTTSCTTTTSTRPTSTSTTSTTPTSTSFTTTTTATTPFSINTIPPTPTGIPTSCTNTWTNTFAFTSDPACPSIYEVGTYCGFVNPEDPCATQPDGYGPVASPDTPEAFLSSTVNKNIALSAKTPAGYAQTFQNLQGATSAASYLGLKTLKSYDVAACAAECDSTSTCTSFNLYLERDPSLNPSDTYCCPNPASITNFKCTLWGSIIDSTTATNTGQGRADFQIVITASNGYTKANTTAPETPPGWSNPQPCNGGTHSHSSTNIGTHFFPGPFNPLLCASYAQAQNIKNGAVIGRGYSSNHCNFFNAYMLKKNGKPLGTYCSLFAQQYQPSQATYSLGWFGSTFFGYETSWSFCLN